MLQIFTSESVRNIAEIVLAGLPLITALSIAVLVGLGLNRVDK